MDLQQEVHKKSSLSSKTLKQVCVFVDKIDGIEVLIGLSTLIFFAYSVGLLITIEKTLKTHEALSDDEFKTKLRISRIELHQLQNLFLVSVISLTSVISIWVWNYLISTQLKMKLVGSRLFGMMIILFFFIVSVITFFTITKKSFSNEPIRILNVGTLFFTTLILFLYGIAFLYNKWMKD